ncbi:MAG: hypothetical protein KKE17_03370 [Proteobacteria bacterium]|nr:hypothetical protein [Pseudomonadota bacterium]MBU1709024.1 hypothetical protein [Pseudomonadota bacterium]
MKNLASVLLIILVCCICGCVSSSLPLTSNLNDFVIMGINTNSADTITYDYQSKIVDGGLRPFSKDKGPSRSGQKGYNQSTSSTLGRMFKEYIENKFTRIDNTSNLRIQLTLDDFWLEEYRSSSAGKEAFAAFFGGEVNYMCVAKMHATLTVQKDGEQTVKKLSASSEDTYIQGYGTGTQTSSYHRGTNSLQHVHARNINKINNKILMLINNQLAELKL